MNPFPPVSLSTALEFTLAHFVILKAIPRSLRHNNVDYSVSLTDKWQVDKQGFSWIKGHLSRLAGAEEPTEDVKRFLEGSFGSGPIMISDVLIWFRLSMAPGDRLCLEYSIGGDLPGAGSVTFFGAI